MKKVSSKEDTDHLRSEYDLSKLKGGVRGKYYQLQKLGYSVFHYAGSEIWADVFNCANDALTALQKSIGETA